MGGRDFANASAAEQPLAVNAPEVVFLPAHPVDRATAVSAAAHHHQVAAPVGNVTVPGDVHVAGPVLAPEGREVAAAAARGRLTAVPGELLPAAERSEER